MVWQSRSYMGISKQKEHLDLKKETVVQKWFQLVLFKADPFFLVVGLKMKMDATL